MPFTLPKLPYDYSALEPHIDTRTMAVHHDKHHQGYVTNLNKALEGYPDLQDKNIAELLSDLDSVPEEIRTAVRNNGGGHANHTMFWSCMSPKGGGEPSGKLKEQLDADFGSFEAFKEQFSQAAMARFGSGWAWLCVNTDGKLIVTSTPNQDNPISAGLIPILGLDVWEHAYYLSYQNRRADYVSAWWHVVSWEQVSANFTLIQFGEGIVQFTEWTQSLWKQWEASWNKLQEKFK